MSNTIHLRRNYVSLSDAARVARALDAVDSFPGKHRHINQLCADQAPAILVEVECGASQASVARRIAAITGLKNSTCLAAVKAALATVRAPNPEQVNTSEESKMAHEIRPRRAVFAAIGAIDPTPGRTRTLAQLARDLAPAAAAAVDAGESLSSVSRVVADRLSMDVGIVSGAMGKAVNAYRAARGLPSVHAVAAARFKAQQEGGMQRAA